MAFKTALYDNHVKCGGRMVEFNDFLLPVQYTSIIEEHRAVRQGAGMFDVSHMGEILITGDNALDTLNYLLANDFTDMYVGQVRYSMMLNPDGTVLDDVLVYKFSNSYLVVVNAGNTNADYEWMKDNKKAGTTVLNMSEYFSEIALQGPKSEEVLNKLIDTAALNPKNYSFNDRVDILGHECIVSRTGYTGERGFEIYTDCIGVVKIWEAIMDTGNVTPSGLGARDTLRLEAAMPLYGHEISRDIMANEVGLNHSIKLNKDFIGRDALLNYSPRYMRTGIVLLDRGIAREGSKVYLGDKEIGYVTSGTMSPLTGKSIAMVRVAIGSYNEVLVEVRGRMLKASVSPLPFYKRI